MFLHIYSSTASGYLSQILKIYPRKAKRIYYSTITKQIIMMPKIFINADGGARRNPGPAAIGIVICDENRNELECYKECIGDATCNTAEYKALIKALQLAAKYTRGEVQIFMDSELVVRQVNGSYRIKKDHLLELYNQVKNYERPFVRVIYNNVTRNNQYQTKADQLVNEALDSR
jgi:ribonuclease HI